MTPTATSSLPFPPSDFSPSSDFLLPSNSRLQLFAKLQAVRSETRDLQDEHVKARQELEQTQNELTRELKLRFVSHEENFSSRSLSVHPSSLLSRH